MKSLNFLRKQCNSRNIPIISLNTERYILRTLSRQKPKNCLEIWSAVWYSWIVIWNTISRRKGFLTSFEISNHSYRESIHNHFNLWKDQNVIFYNANILNTNLINIFKCKFNFVFIDAMKREYYYYFKKIFNYLNHDCTIIFDDVIKYKSKMTKLYSFFEKNQLFYETINLDKDDWILVYKHKLIK